MTAGNITRRGKASWRLKFEAGERDPATGRRQTCFVTVRGTKKDAQRELIRLLARWKTERRSIRRA
jgi:integrase